MQDIRFLWPADEAIASLSPATREAITAAVQDAADDGASFARLGYALARAAGMVAVVQPGGGGTVEVLALVSETDWETNAAHCTPNGGRDAPAPEHCGIRRIVWSGQAALRKGGLSRGAVETIEAAVVADFDALGLPEVFINAVETGEWVVTCDLDERGTASIFSLIEPADYLRLVEAAGEDGLMGVSADGPYLDRTITRH